MATKKKAKGVARTTVCQVQWEPRFWHTGVLDASGALLDRFRKHGVRIETVTVSVHEGTTSKYAPTRTFNSSASLDPFLDQLRTDTGGTAPTSTTFRLRLEPEAAELSSGPAVSAMGSSATPKKPTKTFELLVRPVEIDFKLDASYRVVSPTIVSAKAPHRGPHAAVRLVAGGTTAAPTQTIDVDWKPDWLRRVKSAVRPQAHGRSGTAVSVLVLHQTGGSRLAHPAPGRIGGALQQFLSPKGDTGTHYVIDLDGHVVKLIHDDLASYHTNASSWRGSADVATRSIGIEHVHHEDQVDFPAEQIEASKDLCADIVRTHSIERWNVVGHADVRCISSKEAPKFTWYKGSMGQVLHPSARASCPGTKFPWDQYEAALALTPAVAAGVTNYAYFTASTPAPRALRNGDADAALTPNTTITDLQTDLESLGWTLSTGHPNGTFDDITEVVVKRFQARFMLRGATLGTHPSGRVDAATGVMIKRVVKALRDAGVIP